MEPQRKTTILLPTDLHERLTSLAQQRGVSMGHLIRAAVRERYGLVDSESRLVAVQALADLSLPVDTVAAMKAESNPYNDEPLS